MSQTHNFQKIQQTFLSNIRQPTTQLESIPNVTSERMQVYKELVYNNIESTVRKTFPVISKILTKTKWHHLVRKFISTQELQSPYFQDISKEFVRYLSTLNEDEFCYPFLAELAHYEWIELDVELQEDNLRDHTHLNHQLTENDRIYLAPTTRILTYDYPVHQLSAENMIFEKPDQPTFLVVYRTLDYQVKFMQINLLTACLLELISDQQNQLKDTISELSRTLKITDNERLHINAKNQCQAFLDRQIIFISA